jgi:hypothetical protein
VSLSLRAGVSGIFALSDDRDHAEDTTLLGSQEKGRVKGTNVDYTFLDTGVSADLWKNYTVGLTARFPLSASGSGVTENSFVVQVGLSLCVKF